MRTIIEGNTVSFAEEVAGALADKVNYAVEITANGKIQLANAGNCGLEPNLLVLPRAVFTKIKRLAEFIELIKYTQKGVATEELLAELFGIDQVVVAGGIENKANEGQAVNPGQIWGDNVVLAHVDPSQDLKAPNYGRTFAWTGETGGGDNLAVVESYREETKRSDIHRARHDVDEKVTGAECSYLLSDVLT